MSKKLILIILLVALPLVTWFLYRPARVLLPAMNGMTRVSKTIYLEDPGRATEATELYTEAVLYVNTMVGQINKHPRVIFCSTKNSYQSFGFHTPSKAHAVGVSGIVVGPQGWSKVFLRHELIHHLQAEKLGILKQWKSPNWFKEGMAYSLSADDRPNLPEPFQQYRSLFETWYASVGKERLWEEARKL